MFKSAGTGVEVIDMSNKIEIVDHLGVQIPIDLELFAPEIVAAIKAGAYELPEWLAVDRLLRRGDVVLEIGGGCGFLSAKIALDPRAERVISAEPNPELHTIIELLYRLNGVAPRLLKAAIGARQGRSALDCHTQFWGSRIGSYWGMSRQVDVDMLAITQCLADFKPTMLVIDIEGYELTLLENLSDIGFVDALVIETHPWLYELKGVGKLVDLLAGLGLTIVPGINFASVLSFCRTESERAKFMINSLERGSSQADQRPGGEPAGDPLAAILMPLTTISDDVLPLAQRILTSAGADAAAVELLEEKAMQAGAPIELLRTVAAMSASLKRWHAACTLYERLARGPAARSVAQDLRNLAWVYNATRRFREMLETAQIATQLDPISSNNASLLEHAARAVSGSLLGLKDVSQDAPIEEGPDELNDTSTEESYGELKAPPAGEGRDRPEGPPQDACATGAPGGSLLHNSLDATQDLSKEP